MRKHENVKASAGDRRWWNGMGLRGARWIGRLAVLGGVIVVVLGASAVFAMFGNQARAGTSSSPPRPAALHPPSGLYVFGSKDGTVVLSWQPARPAPVGYRIYRATGRHGPYRIVGAVAAPDIDTFTDDTDIVPGTTYAYRVASFNRQGESAPVGPIVAVLLSRPAPTATPGLPPPLPTLGPVKAAAQPTR